MKFFENMTTGLDLCIEKRRSFSNGELCTVEWVASGTHKDTLQLPDGVSIPATNKSFRTQSVGIYKVNDGKITEWRVYADRIAIFNQLGIKPS